MPRASLQDHATLRQHGYRVERYHNGIAAVPGAWLLVDPDGDPVSGVLDTQWEAVAAGLQRITDGALT